MEILKKVNIKRIKKCELCKSILIYDSKDVKGHMYRHITCPVCGQDNDISIFDRRYKKGE